MQYAPTPQMRIDSAKTIAKINKTKPHCYHVYMDVQDYEQAIQTGVGHAVTAKNLAPLLEALIDPETLVPAPYTSCPECGQPINDSYVYCPTCGSRLHRI